MSVLLCVDDVGVVADGDVVEIVGVCDVGVGVVGMVLLVLLLLLCMLSVMMVLLLL